MVNTHKYTPILKWKTAEKGALKDLADVQKDCIIPLLEFVRPLELTEKDKKDGIQSPEDKLCDILSASIPNDIALSWGDGRVFFADFTLIFPEDLRTKFSELFCENAVRLHLDFIPVVNLTADSDDFHKHIVDISKKHSLSGICIRISSFDIRNTALVNNRLNKFTKKYSYNKSGISLLIDLKENVGLKVYNTAFKGIQEIEAIDDFDNIILAGGAFPEDMTPYKIDTEINSEIRNDWIGWSTCSREPTGRIPAYGDYTIRHPIYNETVLRYAPSTTIKYTLPDTWRFFKGRAKKNEDYLANAELLRKLPVFLQYGAEFSSGDRYINEKGLYHAEYQKLKMKKKPGAKIPGAGRTEDWLRAGINHHIAVVIDQLAKFHD